MVKHLHWLDAATAAAYAAAAVAIKSIHYAAAAAGAAYPKLCW